MVQKTASSRMATRKRKFTNNDDKAEAFSSPSSPAASAAAGDQPRKRYMGVRQSPSGRWVAEIKGTAQKIRLWLGTFDTAEQAAHAYDEAACLLRGANTRTNFWPRSSGCSGRPPHAASSILPAKVFNHLLRHIETQRAAQFDNQAETEHINRTAYSDPLLSDVSISSATQSNGEENEFSMSYCNTESDCVGGRQKGKEEEVDKGVDFAGLHLRSKEEFLSFDAPFEMSMVMEEARRKEEMGAYEYWLMLSYAAKNV